MPVRFLYENDYLVGGPATAAVTPSFRLNEYARPDGTTRVHRELVASIQVLRDALGAPLKIASLVSAQGLGNGLDGRFAWLEPKQQPEALARCAAGLMPDGHFTRAEQRGALVYVEMPDPANLPPVRPELALDHAVRVTAAFETAGDPFQQVTGNFDGAGLSFGPLQVNFKTGTLQALFARFAARDANALRNAFGASWTEWQRVVKLPASKQVAWADALSRGARKADFAEPWKSALQSVGREPVFQSEMLRYANEVYGHKLNVALAWLRGLTPLRIGNQRCVAALYDLCVQQGSLDKAHDEIRRRVAEEKPKDEFQLTRIAVEERGRTASPEWRADCISRRLCVLERAPVQVNDSGRVAERDNPRLYLLRNALVTGVEQYLS